MLLNCLIFIAAGNVQNIWMHKCTHVKKTKQEQTRKRREEFYLSLQFNLNLVLVNDNRLKKIQALSNTRSVIWNRVKHTFAIINHGKSDRRKMSWLGISNILILPADLLNAWASKSR